MLPLFLLACSTSPVEENFSFTQDLATDAFFGNGDGKVDDAERATLAKILEGDSDQTIVLDPSGIDYEVSPSQTFSDVDAIRRKHLWQKSCTHWWLLLIAVSKSI